MQIATGVLGYGSVMVDVVLILDVVASWAMVGLIWFVQVVHYPLLAVVPVQSASGVALEHQRRTAWVVMTPMAVQGFTSLALLRWVPKGVTSWLPWLSATCVGVALASTVLLSVPRHARMANEPSASIGRELVLTNWPRTIAWSASGVLLAVMLLQRLG
jgi:hypothetical protein